MASTFWEHRGDWFEDQEVGRQGYSPTRTLTDHDLLTFGGLTGDMAELHTSDTYAATTEFGGRIAHGMFLLALSHGLVVRSGRLVISGLALLGWQEVRFRAPVFVGDTVRAQWRTIALRGSASRPDAGIVTDQITLYKSDRTVVLTGEVAELVRRSP
jgi:acyl dehydratase